LDSDKLTIYTVTQNNRKVIDFQNYLTSCNATK